MPKVKKTTLSGAIITINSLGHKTAQGNGKRSKPRKGKKLYKGQGKG